MRTAIPSLTGLRFMAAFMVVIAHATPFILPFQGPLPPWYVMLQSLSGIGMTMFFVLSGFVIHYNYSRMLDDDWRRGVYNFFVARFARLYPLFFACMVYTLVFAYTYSALPTTTFQVLPYYATMTQTWLYCLVGGHSLVYQFGASAVMMQLSWSISTEWFFYCVYPILCLGLLRLRGLRATLLVAAVISILAILLIVSAGIFELSIDQFAVGEFGANAGRHIDWSDSFFRWLLYFSPYSRISEFCLGCLCANAVENMRSAAVGSREQALGMALTGFALLALVVIYVLTYGTTGGMFRTLLNDLGLCFGPALPCALLIFCCARYDNWVIRLLSRPLLIQCGEASYSLYLLHLMVILAFRWEAAPITSFTVGFGDFLRLALTVMSAIGLSIVSWRIIEVPARHWLRGALTLRTPVAETALAP